MISIMRGKSRGFGSAEKETLALCLQGCDSSTALLGNMGGERVQDAQRVF